jgi:molybdopterin converting factor small subunit
MIVQVKLYASLRRYRPGLKLGEVFSCELSGGATIDDLVLTSLQLPDREVAITLVNGLYQTRNYQLAEGDQVSIWPPIAGG